MLSRFEQADSEVLNYLLEFVNWSTLSRVMKNTLDRRREEKSWQPRPHFGTMTCALCRHTHSFALTDFVRTVLSLSPSSCPSRLYSLSVPHLSAADQGHVGTSSTDED